MRVFLIGLELSQKLMRSVLIYVEVLTELDQNFLTRIITQTVIDKELNEFAELIEDHGLIGSVHLFFFLIDIWFSI